MSWEPIVHLFHATHILYIGSAYLFLFVAVTPTVIGDGPCLYSVRQPKWQGVVALVLFAVTRHRLHMGTRSLHVFHRALFNIVVIHTTGVCHAPMRHHTPRILLQNVFKTVPRFDVVEIVRQQHSSIKPTHLMLRHCQLRGTDGGVVKVITASIHRVKICSSFFGDVKG